MYTGFKNNFNPTPQQKEPLLAVLTSAEDGAQPQLDTHVAEIDKAVWAETDCLACANCCRSMTPQFTPTDIKRIATHFRMTAAGFKQKWLVQDKKGNWTNRVQPCPFLDLQTAKCAIYAIRPTDCAGFPHLTKTPLAAYAGMHRQNISFCPATFKFLEKLRTKLPAEGMDF